MFFKRLNWKFQVILSLFLLFIVMIFFIWFSSTKKLTWGNTTDEEKDLIRNVIVEASQGVLIENDMTAMCVSTSYMPYPRNKKDTDVENAYFSVFFLGFPPPAEEEDRIAKMLIDAIENMEFQMTKNGKILKGMYHLSDCEAIWGSRDIEKTEEFGIHLNIVVKKLLCNYFQQPPENQ